MDLGNAQLSLISASNAVITARAALNRSVGLAEEPGCRIAAASPAGEIGLPFEALLATARERHPELQALRAQELGASAAVDEAIADLYPSLSLSAGYSWGGNALPLLWNWAAAAQAGVNLFSSGRKTSRIEAAVEQAKASRRMSKTNLDYTTIRSPVDGVVISRNVDEGQTVVSSMSAQNMFQIASDLTHMQVQASVELPTFYGPPIGSSVRHERARAMLRRLGLGERFHHHPRQLSGGQQQRVAIARALINQPSLVLADEPTGNLDSKSGREIMEVFKDLNAEGITLIMVTHEDDIARYAQRVIHMRDGSVV